MMKNVKLSKKRKQKKHRNKNAASERMRFLLYVFGKLGHKILLHKMLAVSVFHKIKFERFGIIFAN